MAVVVKGINALVTLTKWSIILNTCMPSLVRTKSITDRCQYFGYMLVPVGANEDNNPG